MALFRKNRPVDTREATQNLIEDAKQVAKDAAQLAFAGTKGKAQSTYGTLKTNLNKTQAVLTAAGDTYNNLKGSDQKSTQNWNFFAPKEKTSQKRGWGIWQDTTSPSQARLAAAQSFAQDKLSLGNDYARRAASLAQDKFFTGSDYARKFADQAQGSWQKAQTRAKRNLQGFQDTVNPTLSRTQDTLSRGYQQTSSGLRQAVGNARDRRIALQEQYVRYQRRRQRAKTLFRVGVVAGIAGAFLFTPIAGSEVRDRIITFWNRYRSYIGL